MKTIAQLRNVQLMAELLITLTDRDPQLPNIGVMYGFPGMGKSKACSFVMNTYNAAYVEVASIWGRREFVEACCWALGQQPEKTINKTFNRVVETMVTHGTPLIVDQMDNVLAKGYQEVVRDIADRSGMPVIMVGEEGMPAELSKHGRLNDRVLRWVAAEYCSLEDAQALASIFAEAVTIADDLLEYVITKSKRIARKVHTNIDTIREHCVLNGIERIDLTTWGDLPLNSSDKPARRIG